jgi:hypothetical protein
MARDDFGNNVPKFYEIISVEDQAAAISHVNVEMVFMVDSAQIRKQASVRTIYQDHENNPLIRSETGGKWKIVQNSFNDIIYAASL